MALEGFKAAASLSFIAYGVRVKVRADDATALRRLLPFLPCGWRPSAPRPATRVYTVVADGGKFRRRDEGFSLLFADDKCICRTTNQGDLCGEFESDVTIHVAEQASRRVFVHAGVVGWRGRAILIPGRSFSGKTRLVAGFLRAGAVFYSDECAVLDADGRVHPYPRALHIREQGDHRHTSYTAEELGGAVGMKPLPVAMVLMSRYKAGARWRPRQLSAGGGILELLAHTYSARREPDRALATLKRVTQQAQVLKGVRGEARQIIESVMTDNP